MDAVSAPTAGDQHAWAPLIDVSDLPLTELLSTGDSVLARSVQRLVRSLDDPDGIISAFQSYASS
ncbi:FXSXX-COOH protein [Dactylosporangium aurantiacum]|uniref:FXSXX-COOH protein n=1 Tax=Dactylosporangium aurantiacum TaxID=35754 RepID=A0A9Q9IH52_9ACTN|nr:FxSxx-COOH cyclophane-containing RiPP peptide [Dactylosporangium aurantiacum]MDG6104881.1 FxSxx-COOH protein [Dactylosporangium aurantiacum]UWZ55576.1 FXSXX-COOH protein [Dactylosporangium aurantiacum]